MSLALSTAERADILRRHETTIRGSLRTKLATIGTIAILAGLFIYGLTTLETSLWKLVAGLGNLGTFVVLMLPPDPGSWARAVIFVKALFETIAIAFLGTVLAAILALPLGFYLAAALVYLRFDETRRRRWYFFAFGLFIAAMLSKTVTCTLPAALLLVFWWRRRGYAHFVSVNSGVVVRPWTTTPASSNLCTTGVVDVATLSL